MPTDRWAYHILSVQPGENEGRTTSRGISKRNVCLAMFSKGFYEICYALKKHHIIAYFYSCGQIGFIVSRAVEF